jgi:hypothetical protein
MIASCRLLSTTLLHMLHGWCHLPVPYQLRHAMHISSCIGASCMYLSGQPQLCAQQQVHRCPPVFVISPPSHRTVCYALQNGLRWLEAAYRDQARGWVGFNVAMSHKITAAADILLMPSRFEPCGLNQLYAMAYGAVPVAHSTGGCGGAVRVSLRTSLVPCVWLEHVL